MAERAAQVLYTNVSVLSANTVEEFASQLSSRAYKPVLIHSDTPKSDLVDMFLRIPGPVALVTEPARVVARSAMCARSLDLQTALRFTSRSLFTLNGIYTRRDVWKIDWTIGSATTNGLADEMCSRLFTSADSSQRQQIREQIVALNEGCSSVQEAVENFSEKFFRTEPDAKTACAPAVSDLLDVADQLDSAVESSGACTFTWPTGVFVKIADLTYLDGPVDMTGPARVLVGGHALSVPKGLWEANVEILISRNKSGNRLLLDVFAEDRPVAAGVADLPFEGCMIYKLQFECIDPYYPIIIRLALLEGAIEGAIDLHCVRLYRIV